jgi:hypothetical protein
MAVPGFTPSLFGGGVLQSYKASESSRRAQILSGGFG